MGKPIPQVKQHPLWQRLQWIGDPVGYMEKAVKDHPDLFAAEVIGFGNNLVFVNHPQAIQQLLTSDRRQFVASGKENSLLKPLLGEYSISMLDGDRHKKRRQLLLPPFHRERMQAYGKLICDVTSKVFDQFTPNQSFTARQATQDISLQVILEAVYGLYDGERAQKLRELLSQISDVFSSPLTSAFLYFPWLQKDLGAWSPWGYFLRQQQQLDKLVYQEIAERREEDNQERQDILSLLMSACDEQGQPMTDEELRDELMTLMFAGHETTATAIAWALYWIHHLPEVKRKLLAELESLGSDPEPMARGSLSPFAIAKLPYLNAVCQETLRIYPVGMLTFPRVATEELELFGYDIKPGNILVGCIYLTHQREDIYPDAKQFRPERFLEKEFSTYEFIPFGGGARRCIGEALAQFELKLAIATILSRYELALANNNPEKPQRRGVTLAPTNGVPMIFKGTT